MEREVLLTGIGGQGIQLGARTLAVAAVAEGREAMVFGSYGASMRGGNSDATVVVGDARLRTPPTVARAWAGFAMHHDWWPDVARRLRPGGVVVVDASVFRGELGRDDVAVVPVEASTIAIDLGAPQAGSMVALGAFVAATGITSLDAVLTATAQVLPSYRARHAEANARAVRAGFELVPEVVVAAWPAEATAAAGAGAAR
jgi:Pyruvate/2-oxoacid:ferredoxin oxidoreductase gamma subunit